MILLEITDDAGLNLYDIIGIKQNDLAGMSLKLAVPKIRNACKVAKKDYSKKVQKGDKDADDKVRKINEAEITLKDAKKREEYDKSLDEGKGSTLEVLRIQNLGSPFFNNRITRFKAVEKMMTEAGMTQTIEV